MPATRSRLPGRGRSLLLAVPGLLLAIAGFVLLVREVRSSHGDPAATLAKWRILRWLAVAAIVAGALVLLLSGVGIMATGRWRVLLLAIPALVLALAGVIALVLAASRSRRPGV